MPSSFSILKSPSPENRARLFLTNAEDEYKYLHVRQQLKDMTNNLQMFNVLASTSGISCPCPHSLLTTYPQF